MGDHDKQRSHSKEQHCVVAVQTTTAPTTSSAQLVGRGEAQRGGGGGEQDSSDDLKMYVLVPVPHHTAQPLMQVDLAKVVRIHIREINKWFHNK